MRSYLTSPRLLLPSGSCSLVSMMDPKPRRIRLETTQRTARVTAAQVRVRVLIRKLRYLSIKTPIQLKERPTFSKHFGYFTPFYLQMIPLTAKRRRRSQLSPRRS